MLGLGPRFKPIWLVASAIAAVAIIIWIWFDDRGSDSRAVAATSAADANRAADQATLEPATPPAPTASSPPDRTKGRVVAVGFPDGTNVPVQLRNMPFPGVRISGTPTTLSDFYQQLAPRARAGDAAAAHELARKLKQCKDTLTSDALLASGGEQPRPGSQMLEFCSGVDSRLLDEEDMWRQIALDAGYYWALQDLARDLRGTLQEVEIWEALWERGHASALQVLKIRHSQGVAGSPPDYVRAYAYKLIEFGLMQAAFTELPSPTPTQQMMLVTVEDSLRQAGSYLSPGETATAVALAVELLRNNRNCCIGKWW